MPDSLPLSFGQPVRTLRTRGFQLFARNTELFPRSANAWDSLGEALWRLDRDDEAVASYEHALEVDPDYQNARTMIDRILAE